MRQLWERLVDDAAIFPPGNAPLERAVAEHRDHLASSYAGLMGPFVVSDKRLPELLELVDEERPLAVSVVVTGGAGAIEPAVTWASRSAALTLRGVEVALRDLDDLAGSARRVDLALRGCEAGLGDAEVYVEVPWLTDSPGWAAALDEIAAEGLRLKLRTGGLTPDAFPAPGALATAIDAALDRELVFKCTAGLHHAIRHHDTESGFVHYGFLNVLLATRAALDGGDVTGWLECTDPDEVVAAARQAETAGARRWFASFGSCSVTDPRDDLVSLGLMEELP